MLLRSVMLWWLLTCTVFADGRGIAPVEALAGSGNLYTASHALLVGVSDYTGAWPDLESVPRELAQVQAALEAQGFTVEKRLDPDATGLKAAFEEFIGRHGYEPGNRLLFFFSGHGHTWEEASQGYLVPTDAPLPATADGDPGPAFLRKALHMSQILAWSRQMTAKHALFLFDSCFSGTVFKTKSLPKRPPHVSRATTQKVRQFITAGSAGEEVPARSVFTPAFVDALTYRWGDMNGDGYITGMELGLYLQSKVPEHARQSPQFGKHPDYHLSRGDFLFETGKAAAPTPPVPPPPPPPPPVQFIGNVQVNVNVAATVFFDGAPVGEAGPGRPLNRQGLPAGPLRVRVEADGHRAAEQAVVVRRGQWQQLVFELEPAASTGRLTVRSNVHGDAVYIDGEHKGSTRLDIELAPGSYRVAVEKAGHGRHEERIDVVAGGDVVVWARLARESMPQSTTSPRRPDAVADPTARHGDPPAVDVAACVGGCDAVLDDCRAAAHAEADTCRQRVAQTCGRVYDDCMSDGSVLVFGPTSARSECLGRQEACERRGLGECEQALGQAETQCVQRAGSCRADCER